MCHPKGYRMLTERELFQKVTIYAHTTTCLKCISVFVSSGKHKSLQFDKRFHRHLLITLTQAGILLETNWWHCGIDISGAVWGIIKTPQLTIHLERDLQKHCLHTQMNREKLCVEEYNSKKIIIEIKSKKILQRGTT